MDIGRTKIPLFEEDGPELSPRKSILRKGDMSIRVGSWESQRQDGPVNTISILDTPASITEKKMGVKPPGIVSELRTIDYEKLDLPTLSLTLLPL